MYSKPLANRMDGPREAPSKVKRGVPLGGAVNFSSFLPQGMSAQGMPPQGFAKTPTLPGQTPANQGASPLEQAAAQSNLGLNQMRAMAALTAVNTGNDAARSSAEAALEKKMGLPLNPRDLFKLLTRSAPDAEAAETAVRVKSHRKSRTPEAKAEETVAQNVGGALEELRQKTGGAVDTSIGKLAAQFESGAKGIAAIGYDRHGGTSYGKYQISSRAGTMRNFIEYCKKEAPDIAERLEKCGGTMNTGGRRGKMPTTWAAIAEEQPERFEQLQDKFIRASHFEPAMKAIAEKSGLNVTEMPFAFQEVVFSTAVQHGPGAASRIISRSLGQVGETKLNPDTNQPETLAKAHETLIRRIYDNRSGQFRSSTQDVQAAVKSRLRQEMSMAITMLKQEQVA